MSVKWVVKKIRVGSRRIATRGYDWIISYPLIVVETGNNGNWFVIKGRAEMNKKGVRVKENEKLRYREAGKGFIIVKNIEGLPPGRKLAKTYLDQFDRRHVQVGSNIELVTEHHCYLGAD